MSMTELERESKRFAGNVGLPIHVGAVLYEHPRPNVHFRGRHWWICSCGKELIIPDDYRQIKEYRRMKCKNPTYTIGLIRSELERVGKWDGFVSWHIWQLYRFKEPKHFEPSGMVWILPFRLSHHASIEILTTPILLLQAASAYMEQNPHDI